MVADLAVAKSNGVEYLLKVLSNDFFSPKGDENARPLKTHSKRPLNTGNSLVYGAAGPRPGRGISD